MLYDINQEKLTSKELEVAKYLRAALNAMDMNCKHTQKTPERIAGVWMREKFVGINTEFDIQEKIPNEYGDDMMVIGPISISSTCAHHFSDFTGKCFIGFLPSEYIIGLSLFVHIVDTFSKRPQLQEQLTKQIADFIEKQITPKGLAVWMKCQHNCCNNRGIKMPDMKIITQVFRGTMKKTDNKNQFLLSLEK